MAVGTLSKFLSMPSGDISSKDGRSPDRDSPAARITPDRVPSSGGPCKENSSPSILAEVERCFDSALVKIG